MSPRTRPEIRTLADLIADIAADDDYVLAMLALERNGHPRAQAFAPSPIYDAADAPKAVDDERTHEHDDESDLDYPDPTGETALRHDAAISHGRQYDTQIRRALRALRHADSIRRRSIPPARNRKAGDVPDELCRRCFVLPRLSDRRYCWRCRKETDQP